MRLLRLFSLYGVLAGLCVALSVDVPGAARENKGSSALPAIHRIDLQDKRVPLGKALNEVRRQTGIAVLDERGAPEPTLALDLRQATFWQAVDAIAAASNAKAAVSPADGSVHLEALRADDRVPPTSYDGDFRVRVLRIGTTREFDSNRSSCTVSLEVVWTRTLRPLLLETPAQDLRVIDDKGKAVAALEEGSALNAVDGKYSYPLDIVLPAFPGSSGQIKELTGKLSVLAPNKMLTFRFDANLKALQEAVPGGAIRRLNKEDVLCRLSRIKLERDRWSLTVSVDYQEGGLQLETFQGASLVLNNDLTLVSKDGKRSLSPGNYVVEQVGSRRTVVTYHFTTMPRGGAEPWFVQYRAPARIVAVPFRFKFRDLPVR